jgi:hypothetical protein
MHRYLVQPVHYGVLMLDRMLHKESNNSRTSEQFGKERS